MTNISIIESCYKFDLNSYIVKSSPLSIYTLYEYKMNDLTINKYYNTFGCRILVLAVFLLKCAKLLHNNDISNLFFSPITLYNTIQAARSAVAILDKNN